MKKTTKTQIVIETREVWLAGGDPAQARCPRCGEPVEVFRLQRSSLIVLAPPTAETETPEPPRLIASGDRRRFCLKALLKLFRLRKGSHADDSH